MYAIIATGGKQHKVSPGQIVEVEKIPGDEGSSVELETVLLVADGENFSVGQPTVEGARVKATILNQGKQRKVLVFKYKNKTRYRRKRGHRQQFTRLSIDEITGN
ncbi:MAG: 50S ribosomal protein L21 [Dehalococcoidia bacterium]